MKIRILLTIVIIVFLGGFQTSFAQKILKSKGFAGFGYRAITQKDVDSLGLTDTQGVIINRIVPRTPAEQAGFKVNDVLKKYDDVIIKDNIQFVDIYQQYYAGDTIQVTFIQKGELKTTHLILRALPREKSEDLDIEYTSFPADSIYLRAVITSPLNREDKKLPALLIVSALSSYPLIEFPYYNLPRELAYDVSKAGFRVLRFEQRGFGDSQGENFRTTDFDTEVRDNLAALDYLKNRKDVDENRIFVFGHSTGGIIAALLAGQKDLAGVITSCTIGRSYYERMIETLRTQGELQGKTNIEIENTIKKYMNLLIPVALGDSLPKITQKAPETADLVNSNQRIMDDRTIEYWHQKMKINLGEVYSSITEPVLIIYGSSDFLTQQTCHETIKEVLLNSGNNDVQLNIIPDLDHAYAVAKDKKTSYENYQKRNFTKSPEVYERIIEWLNQY